MQLAAFSQWVSIVALLLGIGNVLWAWFSRPARDLGTRLDQHRAETDKRFEDTEKRVDTAYEGLKGHDRRIQRVEDDIRHFPTKDDLQELEVSMTAIKTELDIVAKVVARIDDFLRRPKP